MEFPLCNEVSFELSCKAVPIERIIEVLDKVPYGNPIRVMVEALFLTGARMSELDNWEFSGVNSFIRGNYVFWRCGKNQHGQWRREFLPGNFIAELEYYHAHYKTFKGKVFGWSGETLGRYFNKFIRPGLSQAWHERVAVAQRGGIHEYVLQLKGLRKTFATLVFWEAWQKYADAGVAMHMVCKRMRHSTTGMTVQHYIENSDRLNRERWGGFSPVEVLGLGNQAKLFEFENNQMRIAEY